MKSDTVDKPKLTIGKRIECNGHYGVIKYVGSIEDHPSIWLGIDWDDPERGKHDGMVNGVRYFKTKLPKSGSMIRPEKANFGRTLIEAITSRYGQHENEEDQANILSVQKQINAPFLQMVGFDGVREKQSEFDKLEVINVRMQYVSSIGQPGQLKSLCPNVKELDLSKNLVTEWSQIFEICLQLKDLNWLNVSQNLLEFNKNWEEDHAHKDLNFIFPNLRTLISGEVDLDWNSVLNLTRVFPNLEELRLQSNKITQITIPNIVNFENIRLIDLENNLIDTWDQVNNLGALPNLQELILENTGICQIDFKDESQKTDKFPSLRKLVLTDNKIDNWESIGELDKLKNLEDLRFLRNPILETESYDTCMQLTVARIENLKVFNGSEVKPEERKGAEYDYIKKHGLEWISVGKIGKRNEFLKKHNRYLKLVEKYGEPEEGELKVESKLIRNTLVNIDLIYGDRVIKKQLPGSLSVQKVIFMCQKLFGLSSRPDLIYCSGGIEIALDESRDLGFYSVQDGDKIIIKDS